MINDTLGVNLTEINWNVKLNNDAKIFLYKKIRTTNIKYLHYNSYYFIVYESLLKTRYNTCENHIELMNFTLKICQFLSLSTLLFSFATWVNFIITLISISYKFIRYSLLSMMNVVFAQIIFIYLVSKHLSI